MNFKKLLIAPAIILVMSSCTNEKPDNFCRCADYEVMKEKDQFIADKDYSEKCTKYRESLNSSELEEWDNKLVSCPNMKTWMKEDKFADSHWHNLYYTKNNINKPKKHVGPNAHIGRYSYHNSKVSLNLWITAKSYDLDITYKKDTYRPKLRINDEGTLFGEASSFSLSSTKGRGFISCEFDGNKLSINGFKDRDGNPMNIPKMAITKYKKSN